MKSNETFWQIRAFKSCTKHLLIAPVWNECERIPEKHSVDIYLSEPISCYIFSWTWLHNQRPHFPGAEIKVWVKLGAAELGGSEEFFSLLQTLSQHIFLHHAALSALHSSVSGSLEAQSLMHGGLPRDF